MQARQLATFQTMLLMLTLSLMLIPAVVVAQCRRFSTCSACIADHSCGWCTRVDACLEGDSLAATESTICTNQLGSWNFYVCPPSTCGNQLYCYDCAQASRCGWCHGSRACEYGNARNSLKTASPCNLPTSDLTTVTAAAWVYPTNITAAIEDGSLVTQCFAADAAASSGLNTKLWLLLLIAPGIIGAVFVARKLRKRWKNRYVSRVEAIAIDNSGIVTPQQQALEPPRIGGNTAGGQMRISPEHLHSRHDNAPEEFGNTPSSPFHYPPRTHHAMPPPTAFVTPPNRRRSSDATQQ